MEGRLSISPQAVYLRFAIFNAHFDITISDSPFPPTESSKEATEIATQFLGLNGYAAGQISLEDLVDVVPVRDRIIEGDVIPGMCDRIVHPSPFHYSSTSF